MTEQPLSIRLQAIDDGLIKTLDTLPKRFAAVSQAMTTFSKDASIAGKSLDIFKTRGIYVGKAFDDLRASFRAGEEGTFRFGDQLRVLRRDFQQVEQPADDTADAVDNYSKSLGKSEIQGRKFIRSISAIYATFVLLPGIAEQAGEALREAAAGEDVRRSFEELSKSVRVNSEELLAAMQKASRGTITEIELMRQANRAFLAGGAEFAEAIPRLFEIARASAIATGQDVTFVLDSLTKGIAKASIKLIDNAEVYIKVGDAVEEYAKQTGRTADELDEVERRQAILNAVLEEGSDLVERVGSDAELATDAFYRFETAVDNAKRAMAEFVLEAAGPEKVGAFAALAGFLNDIAPALQTIALLKLAGVGAAIGGIGVAIAGLAEIAAPALIALETATLAWDNGLNKLFGTSIKIKDALGSLAEGARFLFIKLKDGQEAAEDFLLSQRDLERPIYTARREIEDFTSSLGIGERQYELYIDKVRELNDTLPEASEQLGEMEYAVFKFNQIVNEGKGSIDLQIATIRTMIDRLIAYRIELSKVRDLHKEVIPTIVQIILRWRMQGLEAERLAQKEAELAAEEERAAKAREGLADEYERMLEGIERILQRRQDLVEDYNRDLEREFRRHQFRINELLIDAAYDRADVTRQYSVDISDAESEYQRAVQDAAREHFFKLEDIERAYQRRMQTIREQYQLTVAKAARRRDVLAIINAREQRQIQEREARRDRDDQLYQENRDYQEQLRQAREAYDDRVAEAKRGLEEELAEIERALQRRLAEEQRAYEERKREMAIQHAERMDDLEADLDAEIQLLKNKVNEAQGWVNAHPIEVPVRFHKVGEPYTPMQHGFSGVVQGPQTFRVEPGVTEYVYASGDFKGSGGAAVQREALAPSQAATSAMALSHSIRGGISVGMSGLSSQLLSGVGPALQDSIGQAVVDAITAGILSSL